MTAEILLHLLCPQPDADALKFTCRAWGTLVVLNAEIWHYLSAHVSSSVLEGDP